LNNRKKRGEPETCAKETLDEPGDPSVYCDFIQALLNIHFKVSAWLSPNLRIRVNTFKTDQKKICHPEIRNDRFG
jgi:hypothetical protein